MAIELATELFATALSPGSAESIRRGYLGYYGTQTWTPTVNLYETRHRYLVCVDLAGVDKEKIDLTVVDNRLQLRGSRAVPTLPPPDPTDPGPAGPAPDGPNEGKVRLHLMEIDHGPFTREVELPDDVRHADIAATYRNGMLWIEIPKEGK